MFVVAALFLIGLQGPPSAPVNTCVSCHLEAGDDLAAPIAKVADDVHGKRGFSCVHCHGGDAGEADMDKAMDPRKGFVGKPAPKQIPVICGKCHSNADTMKRFNPGIRVDQEAEYRTSMHGKRLAQGDVKAATCVSCHGNHGIRAVSDPNAPVFPTHVAETCGRCHSDAAYMKPYGIPTDQAAKYKASVHADALFKMQDLSAPTCNDCHGNHGATPPGTASVANVCGTCHARQSELFGAGPHKSAFDTMGVGECLACHGNHEVFRPTDAFIGTGNKAICIKCHNQGEPGYETAATIRQDLLTLSERIAGADSVLERAARAGMEVSRARFELTEANHDLTNARVLIHSFSAPGVEKATGPALAIADKARQAGENALKEWTFRRKGLAVSLLVIALAIVSVYLKIRQIEAGS